MGMGQTMEKKCTVLVNGEMEYIFFFGFIFFYILFLDFFYMYIKPQVNGTSLGRCCRYSGQVPIAPTAGVPATFEKR